MITWILLIFSLVGIVVGANLLVSGSVSLAKRFNISDFIIGATVIGIGTSFPELVVSIVGAIGGNADIAIGNVVGSNICNILLILGVTAFIAPVTIARSNLKFEIPMSIGVSVLLILLAYNFFNGSIPIVSRIDGIILLCVFAFYMYISFRNGENCIDTQEVKTNADTHLSVTTMKIVAGLALLIIGSHFFVEEAVIIARKFGVSDAFISITMLAVGTSLPELAASVASAVKNNTQMALGNIVGSNIFNISLILGLCAQISEMSPVGINIVDYSVMIIAALLPVLFTIKGRIGRFGGLLMFAMYIIYICYIGDFI